MCGKNSSTPESFFATKKPEDSGTRLICITVWLNIHLRQVAKLWLTSMFIYIAVQICYLWKVLLGCKFADSMQDALSSEVFAAAAPVLNSLYLSSVSTVLHIKNILQYKTWKVFLECWFSVPVLQLPADEMQTNW